MNYNIIIVQVRYITFETKEVASIEYNGFLFQHSYPVKANVRNKQGLYLSTHTDNRQCMFFDISMSSL
jgi:hypothetical protein